MKIKLAFLLLCSLAVSGCIPALFGAAATGTTVAAQDRSVGDAVDDATIWSKIRADFLKNKVDGIIAGVDIDVHEGRVLLTGHVDDDEKMLKAVEVCWSVNGVKEVINEIKVEQEKNKLHLGRYAQDSWITTNIKSKMFFDSRVKNVNYTIETVDSVVYLFGIARTQEELDVVTSIAGSVRGVKKVISYVRMVDSKFRSGRR